MAIENKNVVLYAKEVIDEKLSDKQNKFLDKGNATYTDYGWDGMPTINNVAENKYTYEVYWTNVDVSIPSPMGSDDYTFTVMRLYTNQIQDNLTEDSDSVKLNSEILRYQYNNGQPKVVVVHDETAYNFYNYILLRTNLSDELVREVDLTDENLEYVFVYLNSSYISYLQSIDNTLKVSPLDINFVKGGYYYEEDGFMNYLLTNRNAQQEFASRSYVTEQCGQYKHDFYIYTKYGYSYGINKTNFQNNTQPTNLYIPVSEWNKLSYTSYLRMDFLNSSNLFHKIISYNFKEGFYCIISGKDPTLGDCSVFLICHKSSTINSDSDKINVDVKWFRIFDGNTSGYQDKLVVGDNIMGINDITLSQTSSGDITISQNVYSSYNGKPNKLGYIKGGSSAEDAIYLSEALANPDMYINSTQTPTGPGEYVTVNSFNAFVTQYGSPIYISEGEYILMRFTGYSDVWELYYDGNNVKWLKNGEVATMTEWGAYFYMLDLNTGSTEPIFQASAWNSTLVIYYTTGGQWTMTIPSNSNLPKVGLKESVSFAPYYNTSDGTRSYLLTKDNFVNVIYSKDQTDAHLNDKQNKLVSGTNIKTINNQTLLGSGNIQTEWTGTLDEYEALETKDNNITYYIVEGDEEES